MIVREMSPRTDAASTELSLEGPIFGVGVDVLLRGRVSPRLAERRFTEAERADFADARDVPFAAREAVIKAVGGVGILGAPLREMPVAWTEGRLCFLPGPRYRAIMSDRGVDAVRLISIAAHDEHVIVAAVALGAGPATRARVAWALVGVGDADEALLSEDERAFARARPNPRASVATRCAARLAARELGIEDVCVTGGGDDPPRLVCGLAAHLSLAHEDELAVALVAIANRAPTTPSA